MYRESSLHSRKSSRPNLPSDQYKRGTRQDDSNPCEGLFLVQILWSFSFLSSTHLHYVPVRRLFDSAHQLVLERTLHRRPLLCSAHKRRRSSREPKVCHSRCQLQQMQARGFCLSWHSFYERGLNVIVLALHGKDCECAAVIPTVGSRFFVLDRFISVKLARRAAVLTRST